MKNLRTVGTEGEDRAEDLLVSAGFEILARNFHHGKEAEIDLIAKRENLIIFVEVKLRSAQAFGGALYSINEKKKRRLRKAALRFMVDKGYTGKEFMFRFDLVAFENWKILWLEDMFR